MINYKFITIICLLICSSSSWSLTLFEQRQVFEDAERYIASGQEKQFKSALSDLKNYPLRSYLQYSWLKGNLHKTKEIQVFLEKYSDTPYAPFLKRKWLIHLAKTQQWKGFNRYYKKTNNRQLQCYFYWGQYQNGSQKKALKGAKKLWLVGYSQPKACDKLFAVLTKSRLLTSHMVWQRFKLVIAKNNTGLARYLKKLLPRNQQKKADLWLLVHNNPEQVRKAHKWPMNKSERSLLFAHGVRRLVRKDPEAALAVWTQRKKMAKLPKLQQSTNRRIALALAYRKNKQANLLLKKLTVKGEKVRAWTVRSALQNQDWSSVSEAISRLSPEEKKQERWQYWQARAFAKLGSHKKSAGIYRDLAKNRSYYGFLAADHLQVEPKLSDRPVQINSEQLNNFKTRLDFRAVIEFAFLGRDPELKRQWWHIIKKLSRQEILVAAKIAEQQGWHTLAIFTVAKAKHWDDVNLRFPILYAEKVKNIAAVQSLDPAIVYGLIRRESAFDQFAESPVGARGLMQIMPATGKQIALDQKEKWRSKKILFVPEVNLRYGAFYYKKMLNRFGNFALAAAAYNAGPHRVKRWLPTKKSIPADIWIETIPFTETREYVAAVLAYALIYQKRLGRNTFKFKNVMLDIKPV